MTNPNIVIFRHPPAACLPAGSPSSYYYCIVHGGEWGWGGDKGRLAGCRRPGSAANGGGGGRRPVASSYTAPTPARTTTFNTPHGPVARPNPPPSSVAPLLLTADARLPPPVYNSVRSFSVTGAPHAPQRCGSLS